MDDMRKFVQDKLRPYMKDFDMNNRGNRVSPEMVAGIGGFLEELIVSMIDEYKKESQ